ncbi:MAG: cation:proton antiporter [Rhodanobacteraceae bacterium]|jgi:multicomponent K+:H+ antiporter subunit G|nr:cation:proton antiporter [Rhodanobacteraceae bacterium]
MSAPDLPPWAALVVSLLVLFGGGLTLTGAFGLLRLKTFYERVHAPTLGTTLGAASILLGSIVYFSALETRPVLHELLIGAFLFVTAPITLLTLVRATLYRDRHEDDPAVPPVAPPPQRDADAESR